MIWSEHGKIFMTFYTVWSPRSYPDAYIYGDTKISDPNDIANAFNDGFVNLGPSLTVRQSTSRSVLSFANP